MNDRLLKPFCLTCLIILLWSSISSAEPASGPNTLQLTVQEKAWLQKHQTIRVAFDGYFPPYSFLAVRPRSYANDNNTDEGMAVDIFQLMGQRLGVTFLPFQKPVWKDLYEAAKRREIDVVATMGNRPDRHQWFSFTRPYIFKSLVIMTQKARTDISKPAELSGKKVAVVKSYQYVTDLLDKYPAIIPLYVNTMFDGLNAVAVGRADAAITFLGAGYYLKNKYHLDNLKFAAIYDRDKFSESIGVRKDWPMLVAILDKALASIDDETMTEISRRWLGPEVSLGIAHQTVFIYLAVLIGGIIVIIIIFSIWNRTLRRQVNRKTAELVHELQERRNAEEALRDSEELFRHYFEQANIGFALTSPQKGWLRVNRCLSDMLGYSTEELFSKTWAEMTHPDDLSPDLKQFERVLAGEIDNYELDKRFYRRDSSLLFTHLTVSCIRKPDNSARYIIATLADISSRKKAEEQLRRSNRSLNAINRCNEITAHAKEEQNLLDEICRAITKTGYLLAWIGVPVQDENQTVRTIAQSGFEAGYLDSLFITWSDSSKRGRGPTGTALRMGKTVICRDIHTDPQFEPWRAEAEKRGYAASIALPLILNDHLLGVLSIYAAEVNAFDEEEVRMLTGMAENISFGVGSLRTRVERNKAVLELQEHRDHLEELVQARTAELRDARSALINMVEDLNNLNARLKELDRLKSMFIASMSHELRTPLNSIIGFTGIILQGMTGEINAEQRDQLKRVSRAGKHLLELITDVIDIARIESGKIQPYVEEFSLSEVIDEACASLQTQMADKGLELLWLGLDLPITMQSDRRRLLQCLLNYLSNAVKFSQKGKITVEVKTNAVQQAETLVKQDALTDGRIEISVTDTGIGIKKDDLKLLFDPFVRLDSPLKMLTQGTGLGLYLTKKLAEEVLAGEVGVESVEGRYSRFWLRVPKKLHLENA